MTEHKPFHAWMPRGSHCRTRDDTGSRWSAYIRPWPASSDICTADILHIASSTVQSLPRAANKNLRVWRGYCTFSCLVLYLVSVQFWLTLRQNFPFSPKVEPFKTIFKRMMPSCLSISKNLTVTSSATEIWQCKHSVNLGRPNKMENRSIKAVIVNNSYHNSNICLMAQLPVIFYRYFWKKYHFIYYSVMTQ